jgi:hypothetical protein
MEGARNREAAVALRLQRAAADAPGAVDLTEIARRQEEAAEMGRLQRVRGFGWGLSGIRAHAWLPL